jgi:hypothetical protein
MSCTPHKTSKLTEDKRTNRGKPTNNMGSRRQQNERTQQINSMVQRNVKVPKTGSGPVQAHDRIYQINTSHRHIREREIMLLCLHCEVGLSIDHFLWEFQGTKAEKDRITINK